MTTKTQQCSWTSTWKESIILKTWAFQTLQTKLLNSADDTILAHRKKTAMTLGNFRLGDEDDYDYEFSVLMSTRTSKNVGLQILCACSVRKTRTGTRPHPPI